MPTGVFIKENNASSIFQGVTSCTQDQKLAFSSFSSSEMKFVGMIEKGYQILTFELTVSFAPQVLSISAGRGSLFFREVGRGRAG